ncbi:RHS repeat-associated core domain-containing protein [Streptomyces sp. NPDC000410]|uniref:RHS repeat-associated core domain-containing protein n=1 Tax=Streptomyces sp. NPDC000410 TaxID=3154254 RepID=UPI0033314A6C
MRVHGERFGVRLSTRWRPLTVGALVLALAAGTLSAQAAPAPSGPSRSPAAVAARSTTPSPPASAPTSAPPSKAGPARLRPTAADAAPTTSNAVYAYDAAGRLVGVTDLAGETARYRYDAAGNRLGIDRFASATLSVLSLVPVRAAAGATVTLSGTGFSATAASNAVSFGGAAAEVVSATPTRLVVTVPAGAVGGKVTVTVGGVTAASAEVFTSASGGPRVTAVTPGAGLPGTLVTLTGSGFAPVITDNVVRFNGQLARAVSLTQTALTVEVPPGVSSGAVEVATPDGVATAPGDFTVPSEGVVFDSSERTSVSAQQGAVVSVTTAGHQARVLFDAEVGDDIGFGFTENTFTGNVTVRLISPLGRQLGDDTFGAGEQNWEAANLPVAGTYSLVLAPAAVGAVRVTVSRAVTGKLDFLGDSLDVPLSRPGQDARFTFAGLEGESASLGVATPTLTKATTGVLYGPDGLEVAQTSFPAGGGASLNVDELPESGLYTFVLDPHFAGTGTLRVQASHYRRAGQLDATGPANRLELARLGQRGVVTFDAEPGKPFALGLTDNSLTKTLYTSVFAPSGATLVNRASLSAGGADSLTLPEAAEAGTYLVVIDPDDAGTGGVTLTLSETVRLNVPVDGQAGTLSLSRAGQQGLVDFTAPEGSLLGLGVTGNTFGDYLDVKLLDAAGAQVEAFSVRGGSTSVKYLDKLNAGARYTLHLEPEKALTGSASLWLSAPVEAGRLDDKALTGQITRPGQQLRYTVQAAAGDGHAVAFQSNTFTKTSNVDLVHPDGVRQSGYVAFAPGVTGEADLRAPLAAGTYQLLVRPTDVTTGAMTAQRLADVDGGHLTIGSPPRPAAIAAAGQNAHYTFTGSAGQKLVVGHSGSPSAWSMSVSGPDGKWLVNNKSIGATATSTALAALPATGTYTITVDPSSMKTGTWNLGLTAAPAVAAKAPTSAEPDRANATDTPGAVPTGADTWQPGSAQLAGRDWVTARGKAPAAPPRLRAPPGATALTGHLLRMDGTPLAKATVSVGTKTTRTDGRGRFLLTGIDPAATTVIVDGTSANTELRTYGRFDIRIHPKAGQSVDLGFPVWMTPLDTKHTVRFVAPATAEVVLKTPKIPGLEVRIPKGSVVRDEKGRTVTELGITAIPIDRPPFPLPKNSVIPVYFTVQPGGTYVFPEGARIIYPNYTREAPGSRVEFMDYDPKKKGWYVYGHGQVSADGRQVVPDAKTRVWAFHGAMFNTGDLVPWDLSWFSDALDWMSGDPVHLGTGMLTETRTDLAVDDPLAAAEVTRTYWQGDTRSRAFGIGRDLSYNAFLHSDNQYTEVDLYLPGGQKVHYVRTSPGTGFLDAVFQPSGTPTAFHGSKIVQGKENPTWEVRLRDGTTMVFRWYGALREIRDRHGNRVQITRGPDDKGDVQRITTPGGRWISLEYDDKDRVKTATDNTGRTTAYTYDTAGRLETVTDPAGKVSRYTYDGTSNRIATATDARGITYMTNTFHTDGRVKEQTLTEGQKYSFEYTQNGTGMVTSATVTQPGGSVRRVEYDPEGYGVKDTEAYGTSLARTTTYERGGTNHRIDAVIDPYGRRTKLTYDTNGYITSTTELAGTAQARTSGTALFDGPYDQPTRITDPLGNATTLTYDADGDLDTVTDPEGRVTKLDFMPDGQLKSVTDAAGAMTEYTYRYGEPVSVKDAEGRTSSRFLDAAGRPTVLTDEAGSATTIVYDKLNQTRSVTDPLGHRTGFGYDDNGNLTTLTDARNNATMWEYDQADRPKAATDPLGAKALFAYHPAGQIAKVTNRQGQIATADYDVLGRARTVKYGVDVAGQAESTATYAYDTVDLPKTITDTAAGNQSFTYDAYDRIKTVTGPTGTVGYDHDAADRRKEMTAAGTTTTYGYDKSDLLTRITTGAQNITFGLDAVGREKTATLPGGITRTTGYDKTGIIQDIAYTRDTSTIGDLTYTRDARGLQTGLTGSLASIAIPAAESGSVFGKDNRLTTFNGRNFTYDNEGQLTGDGRRTYTWNARGQLTGLTKTGEPSSSFGYDPLGTRTSKTLAGTTSKYLTDASNPLVEQNGSGETAATVTASGLDEYLTRTENGQTQVYLTDALGTVVGLANTDGTIATRYTYDPYGQPTTTGAASTNPYTFTGRESDGTGLLYYRNRYYDPETGRFISQDPIGHAGGTNLYQYALSSPTTYTDPTGNNPLLIGCAVGALVDGAMDWGIQRLSGRKVNWGQVGRAAAMGCAFGMLGAWGGLKWANRGCRNSFTADTPVLMADGTRKPIKDIKIGDKVLATDPETGETGPRKVTALIQGSGEKQLVDITIDTGGSTGARTGHVTATAGHPFWVPELREWLDAGDLEPGQWLRNSSGTWIQISAVRGRTDTATAYNLTVDNLHTYYVLAGATPVLVHNASNRVCDLRVFTDLQRMAPGKNEGATSALWTPSGGVYFDSSRLRAASDIRSLPLSLRRVVEQTGHHGGCAEIGCIAQAMEAGDMVRGSQSLAMTHKPFGNLRNRTLLPACGSCRALMSRLGVTDMFGG